MRPRGSPKELERRRLQALDLLREGMQPVEVAGIVGVDRRSVRRWKAAYQKSGPDALKARPAPGRPPRLTVTERLQLESALLEGAGKAGFSSDLWTCPRVRQLIRRRFGVQYHVDHIGRLLRSMGWSPQKPQRRAVEPDEKAIATWVRTEWPRIKKKPAD